MAIFFVLILLLSSGIFLTASGLRWFEFPVITEEFLDQLANRLHYEECVKLCNYLNSVRAERYYGELNCSLIGKSGYGNGNSYDCGTLLLKWNADMMTNQTGELLERSSYAEDLLEIGLRRSNRPDLSIWAKKEFHQRLHSGHKASIHKFKGIRDRADQEVVLDRTTTTTAPNNKEALRIHNRNFKWGIVLLIASVLCFLSTIMVVIAAVRQCMSERNPPPQRLRQLQYSPKVQIHIYKGQRQEEAESENLNSTSV